MARYESSPERRPPPAPETDGVTVLWTEESGKELCGELPQAPSSRSAR